MKNHLIFKLWVGLFIAVSSFIVPLTSIKALPSSNPFQITIDESTQSIEIVSFLESEEELFETLAKANQLIQETLNSQLVSTKSYDVYQDPFFCYFLGTDEMGFEGWFFVDGIDMNDENSFTQSLILDIRDTQQEFLRIPTYNYYDTTLSSLYEKPLDYAYYEVAIPRDLPTHITYDLSLEIQQGNQIVKEGLKIDAGSWNVTYLFHAKGLLYIFKNDGPNRSMSLSLDNLPLKNHVDNIRVDDQARLNLKGWAYYSRGQMTQDAIVSKTLTLRSTSDLLATSSTLLSDVYSEDIIDDYLGTTLTQYYARYDGGMDLSTIPSGSYEFMLDVEVREVHKNDLLKSNYHIPRLRYVAKGREYIFYNTAAGETIRLLIQDIPIQNHVDSLAMDDQGQFKPYGWAFYEGADLNDVNSMDKEIIFRDMTTQKDVIREKVVNFYSTDLSDWSQAKYDYARYNGDINLSLIPSGHYQLLMNIRTKDINKLDALKSNYTFPRVRYVFEGREYIFFNHGQGTGIELLVQDLPIMNHIDSLEIDANGIFKPYGWTIYEGANLNDPNHLQKEIIIRNLATNQDVIRQTVTNIYSTDLSDWSQAKFDYARYNGEINVSNLPRGEYLILINLRTGHLNKLDALKSNYALTNIVSHANGKTYTLSNTGEGTAITLTIS